MASDVLEEETLSDEQIEALIQEAEGRARAKHSAVLLTESEDVLTLDEPTTEPSKRKPIPRLEPGIEVKNYIQERDGVARVRPELVADETQQRLADQLRLVSTKSSKKEGPVDAGDDFFHMPLTQLTPSMKRDLQLISLRSVLDPHRHYKKSTKTKTPQFSQVGTVIEGPAEFYSSRINKKDRAKNFVEEAMTTEQATGRFKRKYDDIQSAKTSGKKGHYAALMKRRKRR